MLEYPDVQIGQPITDESGRLVTKVDTDTADTVIKSILNNKELVKYDVSVGEGAFAETIRMSNFADIKELAQQGVPIPPSVLIDLSLIPEANKKNILNQMESQAQQMMAQKPAGVNSEMK